jgi:2-polyprenyl-6-methoxyphenol hydroxylase-like FAD-dependent oxidoreductase
MHPPPPNKHHLAGKRIIITGAGLSALAFATALDQFWPAGHPKPELVLYERSSRELDREREGYTMSIKPDSGLAVLKELGLLEKALSHSTVGHNGIETAPTIWDTEWQPLLDLNARKKKPSQTRDTIPPTGIRLVRHVLRDILLTAVPSHTTIYWGKACSKAHLLPNGRVRITLADASTTECDLLIAADGANSTVRASLLPAQSPAYAGVVCCMGTSRFPPGGKPSPHLKGKWGINLSSKGVPFLTFPVDDATTVWALSYRSAQPRARIRGTEALHRRQELLDEVRQRGSHLQNPFHEIVEATDPRTLQVFSAAHKMPVSHAELLPRGNVVLIGDANHPVTPFSGSGANMALLDAVVLARQLVSCGSVRAAIKEFDAESRPRARKAVNRGKFTIAVLHARGFGFWVVRVLLGVVGLFVKYLR